MAKTCDQAATDIQPINQGIQLIQQTPAKLSTLATQKPKTKRRYQERKRTRKQAIMKRLTEQVNEMNLNK